MHRKSREQLTNTPQPARPNNLLELLRDEVRRVPRPEVARARVPVPLAPLVGVRHPAAQHRRHLRERHGPGLPRVPAVRVLEEDGGTPDGLCALSGGFEEFRVEGDPEVHFGGRHAEGYVVVDGGEGAFHGGVVRGLGVASGEGG